MEKLKEKIKNNKIEFIFILIVCTLFIILTIDFSPKEEKKVKKEIKEVKEEVKKEATKIMVDVKGAVVKPGVYELKSTSRVIDAVNMAGGLNKNADTSMINLSKKLEDEMAITIYTKEEMKKTSQVCEPCQCPEVNSACTEEKETKTTKETTKTETKNTNKKISINTASMEELETLDGIGEAKAKAIVGYRKTNGNFKKIEEIKNVSGIGETIFEKIKDKITI